MRKRYEELKKRDVALDEAHREIQGKIEGIEDDLNTLREAQQEAYDGAHTAELQISDLEHRAQSRRERIMEEYGVDVDEAEVAEDFDPERAPEAIDHLKEKIRTLGPVNLLLITNHQYPFNRAAF